MIDQKSTSQPQCNQISTKFEVEISVLKNGWNLVNSWLILGWEVDFWLRNWFVPTGTASTFQLLLTIMILETFNKENEGQGIIYLVFMLIKEISSMFLK